MNNHELQQRIAYLVEHGGVYDDPLDEIREYSKTNRLLIWVTLVLTVLDIFATFV